MKMDFFTKAAALLMTAAGVLGVAYGIAKYVNEFENAKAEIQNLRGQITQLHEVLAKGQPRNEDARLLNLEKQVNQLIAAVSASSAETPALKPIKAHLEAGQFSGTASDGKSVWPFRTTNIRMAAAGDFEADVEWQTLGAIHRIEGRFSDTKLFFKEVEFVKKGNNVLGCEYTLDAPREGGLAGTYRNCDGNAPGGTIEIKWW